MKDSPASRALVQKIKGEPPNPPPGLRPTIDLGTFGYWFVPLIGLVYATGFLVASTFLREYGIASSELVKAKYIQVGGLFLMACLVVMLPTFWIWRGCCRPSNLGPEAPEAPQWKWRWFLFTHWPHPKNTSWKPHLPGTIFYSVMILTFYAVLSFGTREFFLNHASKVLINFGAPVFYTLIAFSPWFTKPARKDPLRDKRIWFEALAVVVAIGWSAYTLILLRTANHSLGTMFMTHHRPTGAIGFLLFMLLIASYAIFGANRFRHCPDIGSRTAVLLSTGCVIGALLYMAVLAFAYAIYPYIQSSRGGGAFDDAIPVQVMFKAQEASNISSELKGITTDQSSFIIIDQNDSSIFVASNREARGPRGWRTPFKKEDANNKTIFEVQRPKVYEIQRNTISSMTYLNQYGRIKGRMALVMEDEATEDLPLLNVSCIVKRRSNVRAFQTDDSGHFTLALPAGHYTLSIDETRSAAELCPCLEIDVDPYRTTKVDWRCGR